MSAISSFLEDLALSRNVSSSTQNQALNAPVFLYKQVMGRELGELESFARAKRPKRMPVVLSIGEVRRLLDAMHGGFRSSGDTVLQCHPSVGTLRRGQPWRNSHYGRNPLRLTGCCRSGTGGVTPQNGVTRNGWLVIVGATGRSPCKLSRFRCR